MHQRKILTSEDDATEGTALHKRCRNKVEREGISICCGLYPSIGISEQPNKIYIKIPIYK